MSYKVVGNILGRHSQQGVLLASVGGLGLEKGELELDGVACSKAAHSLVWLSVAFLAF